MSLFLAAEKRASVENPSTNLSKPSQWLIDLFGGGESDSGVNVNEQTALKYSAVWNAVTILSSAISRLPIKVFEKDSNGDKQERRMHPASRLLDNYPNEEMSGPAFKQTGMVHNLLWGNFYAGIVRNSRGDAIELILLQPSLTRLERKGSRLVYITRVDNVEIEIQPMEMIHVPGLSTDGLTGLSVISHARNGIGLGLATEKFGSKFFQNGANLSGVIEHPNKFKDEDSQKRFRKSWQDTYSGTNNALKTAILEHGMTYKTIGIPPEDAQFLETRKFGVTEIARWFNLPPHMLKDLDRSTNNNIEQQSIEFVVHSLMDWVNKWQKEFERKLLREDEKRSGLWSIEFNVNALLEGSIQAKGQFIDLMIKNGVYAINDGRKYLGMNKVDGGDRHFIQRDKMPLDRYDEFIDKTTEENNQTHERTKKLSSNGITN